MKLLHLISIALAAMILRVMIKRQPQPEETPAEVGGDPI